MKTLRTFHYFYAAVLCVAFLCVPAARGQQQDQSTPIPAYKSPLASADNNSPASTSSQQVSPDTSSLSGFQNFSLGLPTERSYWQPHAEVSVAGDSNGLETPTGTSWSVLGILSGGVDVHRTSGNSDLNLSYTGGGTFSDQNNVGNGVYQNLSFGDRYSFRRVTISVLDDFSYLPQDAVGFAGLGGSLIPGAAGAGGLGSAFTPGQSILIGQGQSIGNASDVESDVFLSSRSSLTFVGGYSLLHYSSSNLLDYHSTIFSGGYNYQITRKDTIAALYQYDRIDYGNFNQSITSHSGKLSYGRRVTGRLAFQIAAGPQITVSNIAITGTPVVSGSPGAGSVTEIGWTLNTSLNWQMERGSLGAQYFHGITGGSGVLGGAIDDMFTGSATRQVSRTISGSINGGFSRVRGVPIGAIVAGGTPNERYDYVFGGASLARPLSRTLALNLSYQLQYQTSNAPVCSGTTCGPNIIVHLVSFGVTWRDRPRLF
jgi:hypothetical protein